MLPLWFVYCLASIFFLALAEIFQKINIGGQSRLSPEGNNFVVSSVQSLLALGFILLFTHQPIIPNLSPIFIAMIFFQVILSFVANTVYYSSYKGESASISTLLLSSSVFITTPIGIIFYQESRSPLKFLAIGLILISVYLIRLNHSQKFSRYHLFALLAAVLYGLLFIFDKKLALSVNIHSLQFIGSTLFAFLNLIFRPVSVIQDLKKVTSFTSFLAPRLFLGGCLYFFYNKLGLLAYTVGAEVGRIDAINNSVVFLIIFLEVFLLRERTNLKSKIIPALLSTAGLYLLAMVK